LLLFLFVCTLCQVIFKRKWHSFSEGMVNRDWTVNSVCRNNWGWGLGDVSSNSPKVVVTPLNSKNSILWEIILLVKCREPKLWTICSTASVNCRYAQLSDECHWHFKLTLLQPATYPLPYHQGRCVVQTNSKTSKCTFQQRVIVCNSKSINWSLPSIVHI